MAFKSIEHTFSGKIVNYFFDADFSYLEQVVPKGNAVIITDENVFAQYEQKFSGWKTIVIKAGEEHKQQSTVDHIINELINAIIRLDINKSHQANHHSSQFIQLIII